MIKEINFNQATYSIDILPEEYRDVFLQRFQNFNQIQSALFNLIVNDNKSLVICAPTASGKTVLLELAIIHELMKQKSNIRNIRILYLAPLKAIVEEKCQEWQQRFFKFGLKCFTLTGDTEMERFVELRHSNYSEANILLSTPEKFDHLIRNYSDSRELIRLLKLVFIDEVHLLGDNHRGDILEASITRIKAIRNSTFNTVEIPDNSQICTSDEDRLRYVAISATVPNVDDIARWLDIKNSLGIAVPSDYRPVKLTKIVIGFEPIQSATISEYRFDIQLSYSLEKYIREYSSMKPTLVFCSTRRSVELTAKILASSQRSYYQSDEQRTRLFYEMYKLNASISNQYNPNNGFQFKNLELKSTLASGVAFYHSGLHFDDRRLLERLFSLSVIPVMISTSSLSMGVNLPAHLVIIKNTVQYNAGTTVEYEISQILQMIGRAGRPQFDTEAKAIILTKNEKKSYYETVLTNPKNIESNLIHTLTEQLTIEIVLQTINDFEKSIDWVCSTFLFIRIMKNPIYYGSNIKPGDYEGARAMISGWCKTKLDHLKSLGIISFQRESDKIEPTQLAKIITRNGVSVSTTEKLIQFTKTKLTIENLLLEFCKFKEINQDVILRVSEKRFLNELNQKIKFKFPKRFTDSTMKINCLIQAHFECLNIEHCLYQDAIRAIKAGQRVSKCFVEIFIHLFNDLNTDRSKFKMNLETIVSASRLTQTFRASMWYDSEFVAKQLPKIGATLSTHLVENGYTSFEKLISTNPRNIEFCIKRNPPFGSLLLEEVKNLPKYALSFTPIEDDINLEKEIKSKIKSMFSIRFQCKLNARKQPEKSLLKPDRHFVMLIIGCEECDEIIFLQRINDQFLITSDGIINQNIKVFLTNIDDNRESENPNNKENNVKSSESFKNSIKFLGFINYIKESLVNPQEFFFHFGTKNQPQHTIKAFAISESFVGLDCSTKIILMRSDEDSSLNNCLIEKDLDDTDLLNDSDDEDLAELLDSYNESIILDEDFMDSTSDSVYLDLDSPVSSSKENNDLEKSKENIDLEHLEAKTCSQQSKQNHQMAPKLQDKNNFVKNLSPINQDNSITDNFPISKRSNESIMTKLLPQKRKKISLKPKENINLEDPKEKTWSEQSKPFTNLERLKQIAKPIYSKSEDNEKIPKTNIFEKFAEYRRQYRQILPTLQDRNNFIKNLASTNQDNNSNTSIVTKLFLQKRKKISLKPKDNPNMTSKYFSDEIDALDL